MRKEDIIAKIQAALPGARVELTDLTGTSDHWEGVVVSDAFEGKRTLERQRMVYAALEQEMKGPIHAFTFKTLTPDQDPT